MSDTLDDLVQRMGATPSAWTPEPSNMPPIPNLLGTLDPAERARRLAQYRAAMEQWRQDQAARAIFEPQPARQAHDLDLCPLCAGHGELTTPAGAVERCGACGGSGDND